MSIYENARRIEGDINREDHRYRPLEDRLAKYTAEPNDNGCRLFTGSLTRSGYGQIGIGGGGRRDLAHRVAWELANGPIPEGMVVMHSCDVRPCVNLDHLSVGTVADNNKDRDDKGRHTALKGGANGSSKLDAAQARAIYHMVWTGWTRKVIASLFAVDTSTVDAIKSGRNWSHLTNS